MATRLISALYQAFDNEGNPGNGYRLHFYETGTSTRKDTYSDEALTVVNPNPVDCDAFGRPEKEIFGLYKDDYKVVLKTDLDVPVKEEDPIDSDSFDINAFDPRPCQHWGTTTNTADAFRIKPDTSITEYTDDLLFSIQAHLDNNADCTLAVFKEGTVSDYLPALTMKKYDNAGAKVNLEAGDMQAGQTYIIRTDLTNHIVLNPGIPYLNADNITGAPALDLKNCTKATPTVQGIAYLQTITQRIILSNGTDADHDIDFTVGLFNFDDGSGQALSLALTKQIDAPWAEGDNQGMLDTGTVAADTWYYVFAIYNPTSEKSDYLCSLSESSPSLPSGYTKKKFIGHLYTDGSSNIIAFLQKQNEFFWKDPILDFSGAASSQDLPVSVPPGVKAKFDVQANPDSDLDMQLRSLVLGTNFYANLSNDWAVGDWSGGYNNRLFELLVDENSQIRMQVVTTGQISIRCLGWYNYDI